MLKVIELFAGVGGFRIGLERTGKFEVVWSNQWEPSTKAQHASWVYEKVFGKSNHSNEDISNVKTENIPDADVLVGGFPCQDYSVANSLKNSGGIEGKKGVLWWSIDRILREKKNKPKFLILENVDRLLKSPVKQRGRDFAIMLKCLDELDYAVEWRVINAADYGFPQKRRRVFIVGYHKSTDHYKSINADTDLWLKETGTLAKAFLIGNIENESEGSIRNRTLIEISDKFNKNSKGQSPFENSGILISGKYFTLKAKSYYEGPRQVLKDILEKNVDDEFYIKASDEDKWRHFKGKKSEPRVTKAGFTYNFSEGQLAFPDHLDKPSRTIITSEGGSTPSRTKHVIKDQKGLRRLTPVELERLNGFPDNHTKMDGITNNKRAFFMGNALVCGVVSSIGQKL
jgi:DNA (cytosine-5)-methyltransferase 1